MTEQAAQAAARRGMRVFPLHGIREEGGVRLCTCQDGLTCTAPGKHPRVRNWQNEATTDPTRIAAWWGQWPDANVGASTAGLVVMDVDPRNGGHESLAWLEGNETDFPPTTTVRTGSGGMHFIYRQGGEPIRSGVLLEGIDVKADGGYIVAAGSTHISGNEYTLLDDRAPEPAPPWLRPAKRHRELTFDDESIIPAGQRNDFLVHVAGQLRNANLGADAIFAALMETNARRCDPPETEERVREIAAWAGKKDIANPYRPPAEGQAVLGDAKISYALTVREIKAAAEQTQREWLLRDLLLHPTYGMVGGEQKALKSWLSLEMAISLASGEPCFSNETFRAIEARPVLLFYGEGGPHSLHDRLWHLARSRGMSEEDYQRLPIHSVLETVPITTEKFTETIITHVDNLRPALVIIDPLYRYLDANTDMKSLVAVGQTLTQLQHQAYDRGASLLIPHHFNRSDRGGLSRLSGAGGAEWADSWMLVEHREDPDLAAGLYKLGLQVGSRQWDGGHWDINVRLGRMNRDTLQWEGEVEWDVREHGAFGDSTSGSLESQIRAMMATHPGITPEELVEMLTDWSPDAVRSTAWAVLRSR